MKAASRFVSVAMAVALHVGWALPATVVVHFAHVTAAEAAVVNSVDVRGNQRVDAETVRSHVGIEPGESFDNADINEAVKQLFSTGLFADVEVQQSGSTLIVTVDEYPIVNQVLFQGNSKVKDANLRQATQLDSRSPFSERVMENDIEAVREAYGRVGRDNATVTARTQELEGNRVNVIFEIEEGDRTKIATITFTGNDAFNDRRLREVISTKRSNIFSFLFRNDIYDEDRLRADEEALRRFYYDRGYADFRLVSSNAEMDEETNEYTISFTVEEGERYTFGDIDIETTLEGIDTETLKRQIQTRQGSVYSATKVEDSIVNLTEEVAGLGYAFAEVTPRGDRDFDSREISVVYSIDEGQRAYVERIEIRGNTRTRDYVIRREFDISEGDAFNQVLVQRAKKRLDDLDFFSSVDVSTSPGSESDQVVLVVDVTEKPTGEFSIGAGYSTGESATSGAGFSVEGSISERNFLGRGQSIRLSAAGGENSRDFQLSFTEPYFLGRRISAGFDIFRRTRDYREYERETTGATVRLGLPITEALTTQVGYHFATEEFDYRRFNEDECAGTPPVAGCSVAPAIQDAIAQGNWVKSSVSTALVYNTIDDLQNPRDGIHATFRTEVAGLGGDARFVKVTGRGSYYKTLSEEMDLVGLLSGGGGHVEAYDGDLRVFDHFESDSRIIRGFDFNGIGPYDAGTGDHLGGTTYFHATAEAQFPIPLLPPGFGMRGAVFADAATLYGSDIADAGTDMEWRASVGAGIIWASPFGPLRVDYAIPVAKEANDDVQNFNFGISTQF